MVRAVLQLPTGRVATRTTLVAGLRAATATVVPITAAYITGDARFVWAALGGWLTTFADAGGAYRPRARAMGAFALGAALAATVGALAGRSLWVAVPLVLVWTAGGAMLRLYGDAATAVGNLVAITFVASLGTPAALSAALARGAFLGGGSVLATALALVVWPLRPWQPARHAVAECYDALADFARDLARTLVASPHDRDAWHGVALRDHARVRQAIEAARVTLGETRRSRMGSSARGEQLVVLLEIVELEFESLIAAAEALESAARAATTSACDTRILDAMHTSLIALGTALYALGTHIPLFGRWRRTGPPPHQAVDHAIVALWQAIEQDEHAEDPEHVDRVAPRLAPALQAAALLEHAATLAETSAEAAMALVNGTSSAPMATRASVSTMSSASSSDDAAPSAWSTLRANLTTESLVARHAARVGVVAALAMLLGVVLRVSHASWVVTTALIVLQPYAGPTLRRGIERGTWTVLGGIVAAVLAALLHDRLVIAAVMFPLAVASIAVRSSHYGLFTFFLTPVFVLLAEPATGDWTIATVRAGDTLLGGLLAFGASRVLWPSWERHRLPTELGTMVVALRDYFRLVEWRSLGATAPPREAIGAARRRTGLASNNVDAALQRLVVEPAGPAADVESLMTLLTFARRASGALTVLAVGASRGGRTVPEQATLALAIDGVLGDVAHSLPREHAPAPLPAVVARYARMGDAAAGDARVVRTTSELPAAGVGLDRVARQVAVLHGAAVRAFGSV